MATNLPAAHRFCGSQEFPRVDGVVPKMGAAPPQQFVDLACPNTWFAPVSKAQRPEAPGLALSHSHLPSVTSFCYTMTMM